MDADSILQRDSLYRIAQPFIEDSTTVASGGVVRIANGCQVRDGFLVKVGLPRNLLALLQIVEYLRAFLFGRMGWSPFNAVLIISGAFGLFHKDTVISVGGYRTDTVGEDMELVIRLHRQLSQRGQPYRIRFVPDPICWTEVPEDLKTLKSQRIRWQRGLSESLTLNMELLFSRRSGAAGWLAFPFMLIFEFLGPLIEVAGYVITVSAYWLGLIAYQELLAFLMLAIGFGLLLSAVALLLEEISYHLYPRLVHILLLFLVLLVENLGFRQLNSLWRLIGLLRWLFKAKASWGKMTRTASWQTK
jgi:cellulose synthase/poly-beta-1,6-N-acetylglucosamine synthase-like glycosyltransferase